MNDQLKTLVRQAVISVDIVTGNESLDDELAKMYIPDCFAEKFAELIVRECAKVADFADENKCEWIGGNILTHFGVEE